MRVLSYYTVLLVLKSGQLIANQIWEFCDSYDDDDDNNNNNNNNNNNKYEIDL